MSTDPKHEIEIDGDESLAPEAFEDEFETIGDYHRKAAHYFSQAAKHHLAAAAANDEGDETAMELNAFKAYRKEVIDGIRPILSPHFNITVEMPLKAIVRGYTFTTMPITWRNRRHGVAKLKIREMGSRYLFIVLYVWLEKYFSRGDYKKSPAEHS
jgi:hypothetical protein